MRIATAALFVVLLVFGCTFYFAPEFVIHLWGGAGDASQERVAKVIVDFKNGGVSILLLGYLLMFCLWLIRAREEEIDRSERNRFVTSSELGRRWRSSTPT